MKILGIETSCDETGVCVLDARGDINNDFAFDVKGNALASQTSIHALYGGVFPNLAKREHQKNLVPMLEIALQEAGDLRETQAPLSAKTSAMLLTTLEREGSLRESLVGFLSKYEKPDIDAVAVTYGPGLEPALWVGLNFAKALARAWDVPLVGVNHMEGHIAVSCMEFSDTTGHMRETRFPILSLLISGGHTELVLSKEWMRYELIGQTRDDAVGEAFDKVARMLGLPYPGGPEISRLAEEARHKKITPDFKLPRPMLREDNYDFSFSGLKTAVKKIVDARALLNVERKHMIAREFEDTVADVLIGKTIRAVEEFGVETIVVGGGVSANTYIRSELARRLAEKGFVTQLLIPPPKLSTDNAIMIALAGYFRAQKKEFADFETLKATGNLSLA